MTAFVEEYESCLALVLGTGDEVEREAAFKRLQVLDGERLEKLAADELAAKIELEVAERLNLRGGGVVKRRRAGGAAVEVEVEGLGLPIVWETLPVPMCPHCAGVLVLDDAAVSA